MNLLMICTGNTCRSPMAEGFLRLAVGESEKLTVASAGMFAQPGEHANPKAVSAAQELGADITKHEALQLTEELFDAADLVLTMTKTQADLLIETYGEDTKEKVFPMTEYVGRQGNVSDPFGCEMEDYRKCAQQLDVLAKEVHQKLREKGLC